MGQGNVLMVQPGELHERINRLVVDLPLPESAYVGSDSSMQRPDSFYLKIGWPSVDGKPGMVDIVWGLASESARFHPKVFAYREVSILGRYSPTGTMDFWDGSGFVAAYPDPLDTDAWYELWFVIHHSLNTYDLYIKGGSQFPEITSIVHSAPYRMQTKQPLDHLVLLTTAGSKVTVPKGKDPAYFDDIYIYPSAEKLNLPDNRWILIDEFEDADASN